MRQTTLDTPLGGLIIKGDEHGLAELLYSEAVNDVVSGVVPDELQEAVTQLKAYFAGDRRDFSLALNPSGTAFQKRVWQSLRKIPFGETLSYKTQAENLSDPKAIRAVAAANGKNPLPIIVPCHRVIGSDGALTGYSGGVWRKRWLLMHENALPQLSMFKE